MSFGSSEVAGYIGLRPWSRLVRSESLGSLGCALGVIRGRWVHWSVPFWSSGSYRFAEVIGVRPVGGRVYPGSLWFIVVHPGVHPGSLGLLGCALEVVGFIRGRRVHWDALWWTSGSSRVSGFIGVHPGDCQVHAGSLDSLGCALGVVAYIRGCGVDWGAPLGLSVHPVSLGSFGFAHGVVGFILGRRVHWGARRVHLGSPGFALVAAARFIGVRPGRVPVRHGSLGCPLWVILGCRVH